jgi:hypothetical protein
MRASSELSTLNIVRNSKEKRITRQVTAARPITPPIEKSGIDLVDTAQV